MCTPARRLISYRSLGTDAGLVVGDDELAVGVELEPVDDAAQLHAADGGGEPELEPDRHDRGGVLELEVLADEHLGLGVELLPLVERELELGEVGVGREVGAGAVEVGEGVRERAGRRVAEHQVLERPVHERALARRRRRRLREAVQVGEPERERAVLERRERRRRQPGRLSYSHARQGTHGVRHRRGRRRRPSAGGRRRRLVTHGHRVGRGAPATGLQLGQRGSTGSTNADGGPPVASRAGSGGGRDEGRRWHRRGGQGRPGRDRRGGEGAGGRRLRRHLVGRDQPRPLLSRCWSPRSTPSGSSSAPGSRSRSRAAR